MKENNMKICMITGDFPPNCGGIGNYVSNLSLKLKEKGHTVTIITRHDNLGVKKEYFYGIDIYRISCPKIYPFHARIHTHLSQKFFLDNLSHTTDIIHYHSPLIGFFSTEHPSIVTEHGTVFGGIKNSRFEDLNSLMQMLFLPEFYCLDKKVMKNADIIASVSTSCTNEIKNKYNITPEKIFTVGNGVDVNFFCPKNDNIQNLPYVLYTGRLDSRKGLIDLIYAAHILHLRYPHVNFIFTGKGPYKKFIEKKIKQLKLENTIFLVNYVSKNELLKLYQNATIYILPSYYEGLPTSLLEALSCGISCIATNVSGNNEIIVHGSNGLLTPPNNPRKLADSIEYLLENLDEKRKFSITGRETIISHYSWDTIADHYIELYKKLLKKPINKKFNR